MKSRASSISGQIFILLSLLALVCAPARGFTFFYLIQQWPGTYCHRSHSCCFENPEKASIDFIIHGLRPTNFDGSSPSNCIPKKPFDPSQVSDLMVSMGIHWPSILCPARNNNMKRWSHEWMTYGTCSALNQHRYFKAALDLKNKANLLKILATKGIRPDGRSYSYNNISEAIREAVGYIPGIKCDDDLHDRLDLIYLCADTSGSKFIDCPGIPMGSCSSSNIIFPTPL